MTVLWLKRQYEPGGPIQSLDLRSQNLYLRSEILGSGLQILEVDLRSRVRSRDQSQDQSQDHSQIPLGNIGDSDITEI